MKILFFANTDWYLYNFRLPLARFLHEQGCDVLFVSPPGEYGERLRAAGFRWESLPMERRSLNPLRELAVLHRLRRIYTRERPYLVHHFTIKCVVYGSLVARWLSIPRVNAVTGLGHVFTSQSLKARALRPPVCGLLRLALGGCATRLILQNPDDRTAFQQQRLTIPEHIRLIRGSGVDIVRFRPTERAKTGEPLRLLLASRLLWEKGIGEYVEAARRLKAHGMNVECWLAGSPDPGNPASIDVARLVDWRDEGVVRVLGQVDDMAALLPQVDVMVLPSYGEGVPRSLLEAAACGLPLIATDVPGCREVVRNGLNGILIPPRNPEALTEAMSRLAEDDGLRRRFGEASRRLAVEEFAQETVFAQTLAVYRELARVRARVRGQASRLTS
ncbi:glycosyltransferase family 4 protein [Desulfobulbus alkaliphilus]|uniref:glycosyltransferase family 4 protein n=1 Tax=Desulfobulbus alkaliphilus TaxID=869814 RepID=UPI0019667D38|nr:glycosyltransferase family 4 protein [Desulfobulbus alkaliphilus]MBM9538639.1 glycosyltransferase family 4 protein [Desulfobulbus alkaliphilus]